MLCKHKNKHFSRNNNNNNKHLRARNTKKCLQCSDFMSVLISICLESCGALIILFDLGLHAWRIASNHACSVQIKETKQNKTKQKQKQKTKVVLCYGQPISNFWLFAKAIDFLRFVITRSNFLEHAYFGCLWLTDNQDFECCGEFN